MTAQRKFVGRFARDAEALRHPLGGQSHGEICVRIMIDQPRIRRNLVPAHGNHRHRFRAAGDNHFRAAAHDALRRHGNRLQSGRAEAIDRHRRNFDRQPGAQRCDAGHVHPLLGLGHGAAEDHVFNLFGIELRHALERALDGDGRQFIGTGGAQRALEGASYRRANGGGDDDFSHRNFEVNMRTINHTLMYSVVPLVRESARHVRACPRRGILLPRGSALSPPPAWPRPLPTPEDRGRRRPILVVDFS